MQQQPYLTQNNQYIKINKLVLKYIKLYGILLNKTIQTLSHCGQEVIMQPQARVNMHLSLLRLAGPLLPLIRQCVM